MEDLLIVALIIVPIVGLSTLFWFVSHFAGKARIRAMRGIAQELGLHFSPGCDPTDLRLLENLRLSNQYGWVNPLVLGPRVFCDNMMNGLIDGVQVTSFEFRCEVGRNRNPFQQHVISFQSGLPSLPDFVLLPEGLFEKIAAAIGQQDIDFRTHPTFSNRFLLQGPDEAAVRNLFQPAILDAFENMKKGTCVEACQNQFVFCRSALPQEPEQFREVIKEAFHVYKILQRARLSRKRSR